MRISTKEALAKGCARMAAGGVGNDEALKIVATIDEILVSNGAERRRFIFVMASVTDDLLGIRISTKDVRHHKYERNPQTGELTGSEFFLGIRNFSKKHMQWIDGKLSGCGFGPVSVQWSTGGLREAIAKASADDILGIAAKPVATSPLYERLVHMPPPHHNGAPPPPTRDV
jgi:hypothetical protein